MTVKTLRGARTKVNRMRRELRELGIEPPPLPEDETVHSLMCWVSDGNRLLTDHYRVKADRACAEADQWQQLTKDAEQIFSADSDAAAQRLFREASTRHHPDHGGNAQRFAKLKEAIDLKTGAIEPEPADIWSCFK